jgi:oligopeptide/dipeptide ABC transporter ATP-binding protein
VTAPSESTPLLAVEGLTAAFPLKTGGTAAAVDGVSFTVARGETFALVGESGSGKSVTALSIIRLVQPPGRITAGRIVFDGQDLTALDERAMRAIRGRRIGFVFQEPMIALNPVYTIGFQLRETLEVHGLSRGAAARARAVALLDAVRVPDPHKRVDDYPHQLSGGLRQRAMIALALAAEPALVIADEPTTALDVTVQAEILDLLRDMRTRLGLSLLLITHDLGVVAEMADRVGVMYGGRIVETAPASRLFDHPGHPYTRGLLACLPERAEGRRLAPIPGTVPPLGQFPAGCAFANRCGLREARCEAAVPPLTPVAPDHGVRCVLAGGESR